MTNDEKFQVALRHYQEGNLREAERVGKELLMAKPENADILHFLGVIYYQYKNYDLAIHYIEEALKYKPFNAEAYYNLGNIFRDTKQLDKALIYYQKAIENDATIASIYINAGAVLQQMGLFKEALSHYQKAIQLDPHSALAHYNMGIAFQDRGSLDQAISSYKKALQLNPDYIEAYDNLGIALQESGLLDQAIVNFEKAIMLNPGDAQTYNNLGGTFLIQGQFGKAVQCFHKAIELNPGLDLAYANLGTVLREQNLFDDAAVYYRKALQVNPKSAEAYHGLGIVLRQCGKRQDAISAFNRAIECEPNFVKARLGKCISQLPIVHMDQSSIQTSRKSYYDELLTLCNTIPLETDWDIRIAAEAIGVHQPFYLAYQGLNDHDFQKLYGNLACKIMALRYPQFARGSTMPPNLPEETIRIGIVSGFFYDHSVWKIPIKGWIENLDRKRFSLYGYYTGKIKDKATEEARRCFAHFVDDIYSFESLCQIILDDKLHVLIYSEIGQDPIALRLAALKLAPVQCSSALGHPETSGLPTIDYCLSSYLMEPSDADNHYTEQLIRLPNLSLYCTPLNVHSAEVSRLTFGLRPQSVLYFCAHSVHTHLPQYDEVYPRIAQHVDDCQFLFISDKNKYLDEQFRLRIHQAFNKYNLNADRYVVLLPYLDVHQYCAMNCLSDIRLDTIGWSGCNSTFEAIKSNLPVITLPGALMRQRHSAAILTMMGMTEIIASTVDEYITLAVQLGLNRERRKEISEKIAANKHLVYRDRTCITALEDFIEKVIKERQDTIY